MGSCTSSQSSNFPKLSLFKHSQFSFDQIDTNHHIEDYEVDILRQSFQVIINKNRDGIALTMLAAITQRVEGANESYTVCKKDACGNSWESLGLGIILLSGIERLLNRIHKVNRLSATVEHFIQIHSSKYQVCSTMMADALKVSRDVIVEEFHQYNPSTFNQVSVGDLQQIWLRFFALIIKLFLQSKVRMKMMKE